MMRFRRFPPDAPRTSSEWQRSRLLPQILTGAMVVALVACSPSQDPAASPDDTPGTPESVSSSSPAEPGEPQTTDTNEADTGADTKVDTDRESGEGASEAKDQDSGDQTGDAVEAEPPASFNIPAIGASSELLHLGLRENNTLEVPPGDPGSPASWYTGSPAPGDPGPAVLLGHVNDSLGEPGVFADLPDLVEGDEITVEQEDGASLTFEVTQAQQYDKDTFPTLEVYGNTEDPELRLITCDGYNQATGEHEDNYVVYAILAG